jgi:hypothetical protein
MTTRAEAEKMRQKIVAGIADEWMTGTQVCRHVLGHEARFGSAIAIQRFCRQLAEKGLIEHKLVPLYNGTHMHMFRKLLAANAANELQKETA